MGWLVFVAGAVLSWGAYGVLLAQGQAQLGSPLKALLCVGVAYFLIGVLIPVGALASQGALSNFNTTGLITATVAGAPIARIVLENFCESLARLFVILRFEKLLSICH